MTTKQTSLSWVELNIAETMTAIATLSTMESGIYLKLYLRCSVAGYLPDDMRVLRVVCGVTKKQEKLIQNVLDTCFTWVDGPDFYVNEAINRSYITAKRDLPMGKTSMKSRTINPTDRQTDIPTDKQTNQPTDIQTEQTETTRLTVEALLARRAM